MAEARFRTRTPDGRVQLDNSLPGYFFLRKERISVGRYYGTYTVPLSEGAAFVAFRPVNVNHWLVCTTGTLGEGVYSVKLSSGSSYIDGEVDVYLFASYAISPKYAVTGPVRFNLRDAQGRLIFVGTLPPLKVVTTVGGDIHTSSRNGGHYEDGYTKDVSIPPNRTYAVMYSLFLPSLDYGNTRDSFMYEIVTQVDESKGIFKARQKRHKFADVAPTSTYTITYGSGYISHMIVDVTFL